MNLRRGFGRIGLTLVAAYALIAVGCTALSAADGANAYGKVLKFTIGITGSDRKVLVRARTEDEVAAAMRRYCPPPAEGPWQQYQTPDQKAASGQPECKPPATVWFDRLGRLKATWASAWPVALGFLLGGAVLAGAYFLIRWIVRGFRRDA